MEEKLIEEAIQATLVEKQRLEVEKSKEKELLDKVQLTFQNMTWKRPRPATTVTWKARHATSAKFWER